MADELRVADLPLPITASKADWLVATTWLGFTPHSDDTLSRNNCSKTIQRQFGQGYVIEYIAEQFNRPNPGFENEPDYLADREAHDSIAGRLIAVHRLRYSARSLETIIGQEEYERLQLMWAQDGKAWRWSVAFPIVESYEVLGRPKAKEVLGDEAYRRLYAHASATLRPLNDDEREALNELKLRPIVASNAWIAIADEIENAEASEINASTLRKIGRDLTTNSLEGFTGEQKRQIRKRAAWLADKFVRDRQRRGMLICETCGFNPTEVFSERLLKPRSLLDVHHKHPLAEGSRYTTVNDFQLLCPTCHRIEHARMKIAERNSGE